MKIIEAMKKIKHLQEKCADLRTKVGQFCADLDFETPTYPDQKGQIAEWLQAHQDTLQEIARLRIAILRTNLATSVTIDLGGRQVTKTIAEWIHRRGDSKKKDGLAHQDFAMWATLGDRGLKEGMMATTAGGSKEVKIRRHYDPKMRDERMAVYKSEPTIIDGHLEVVNAVTDILE
jgi:hypothetical protein